MVIKDPLLPISLGPMTQEFVDAIQERYPDDENSLTELFCNIGYYELKNELRERVLPHSLKQLFKTLMDECEKLDEKKEDEIRKQNYQSAANCRDEKSKIVGELNSLAGDRLVVTPQTLVASLRAIGFNDELPA